MLKIIGPLMTSPSCHIDRRDFLQAGTAAVLSAGFSPASAAGWQGDTPQEGSLKATEKTGEKHLLWQPRADLTVRVLPPSFAVVTGKEGERDLAVKLRLADSRVQENEANFEYELTIGEGGLKRTGKYSASYSLAHKNERAVLTQKTALRFSEPLRLNLTVTHQVEVIGREAFQCTLPLRYGVVKRFDLGDCQKAAGYYVLGRGSSAQAGEELALAVIGIGFDAQPGGTFAVATDPYCGSQFRFRGTNGKGVSAVTTSYTYSGSLVPLREEARTAVLVSHPGGIDGMLSSYYDAIPEIQPSPAWVQDVQLVYYDYISDYKSKPGQGWYKDVEKLAEKIPAEHRGKVALCLEGYYDYLGRYNYDHERRRLDEEWDSYDVKARKLPMSLAEVHRRIKFAKDRGFRVIWYFADGMSSDTTSPYYQKDKVIKDENGKYLRRGFWQWRPDVIAKRPPNDNPELWQDENITNHLLDPGNPEVVDWFLGYMEALLNEYGRELDGFTWDETFEVETNVISTSETARTYSDRAFMHLVSRLSQLVQEWHKVNPDLVFLSSDDGSTPYALAAHGTYQDSACAPQTWPLCLLINYRTCLWSCNWYPITGDRNNEFNVHKYGLPQGLSNGWGDNQGPSEMPEEILNRVVERFLKRVGDGKDRTRYLSNLLDAMTVS
jgi:hypothetical protein